MSPYAEDVRMASRNGPAATILPRFPDHPGEEPQDRPRARRTSSVKSENLSITRLEERGSSR